MTMPLPAPKRPLWKRSLFMLIALLGVALVTEATAWAAYRLTFDSWFSYTEVSAERSEYLPRETVLTGSPRQPHLTVSALHPYLGYVTNPNQVNRPGGKEKYSRHGFLALDNAIQQRSGSRVIVGIVGGSVAQQFSQHGVQTLKSELEKDQRFVGKELVFVNLAHGGYKQPQQLMVLNYFLAQGAEFDVIINIDGFNEIALYDVSNAPSEVYPLYPVNWHLLTTVPEPALVRLVGEVNSLQRDRHNWAQVFNRSPWCYSVTANFIWKYRDRSIDRSITGYHGAILHQKQEYAYQALGPRSEYPNREALDAELVAVWERCSVQLNNLCKSNGIKYYHFLQPNQYVEGSKEMGADERKIAWVDNHMAKACVEKFYPQLSARAGSLRKQGVQFRDFTLLFAPYKETTYSDTCCHINGKGNEIMARAIADILRATDEPPRAD